MERSCALAGAANRLAAVKAIETVAKQTPSQTAQLARVLFAETERLLARLWYLGVCARAAALPGLSVQALDERETVFAALDKATGARVFWSIAEPGGIRTDVEVHELATALKQIEGGVAGWRSAVARQGALGRAGAGVGTISAERAEALRLTGIAAAGSRALADLRREQSAAGYSDLESEITWPEQPDQPAGDVAARLSYAVEDLATSAAIAQAALAGLDDAVDAEPAPQLKGAAGEGTARVEGPHGPVAVTVALADAEHVARLRLEPPGATLIPALPEILEGGQLAQASLILASLDLCLECLDQ